jgi:trehalose 6-phosphate phosphatase
VKDLLGDECWPTLARLARQNALLAFDYDGTLAPIVADPRHAEMRRETRELLERVARAYPCIVVTGRARQDTASRLRGIGVLSVIGNHGLEPPFALNHAAPIVRAWVPRLRMALGSLEGVFIENKGFSLAIHYRRAPKRGSAAAAILRACASFANARTIPGKCAVNLLPRGAPNKGSALLFACRDIGCDTALYVGDDQTDEDVFALSSVAPFLGVRIGRTRRSRAGFYIRSQRSIDELLRRLLALRRGPGWPRSDSAVRSGSLSGGPFVPSARPPGVVGNQSCRTATSGSTKPATPSSDSSALRSLRVRIQLSVSGAAGFLFFASAATEAHATQQAAVSRGLAPQDRLLPSSSRRQEAGDDLVEVPPDLRF